MLTEQAHYDLKKCVLIHNVLVLLYVGENWNNILKRMYVYLALKVKLRTKKHTRKVIKIVSMDFYTVSDFNCNLYVARIYS